MNRILQLSILISVQFLSGFLSYEARADNMSTFLKNCAYGTLAGAAVGLASLAVSDNPGGKMSNVARGASLGLYVGIGYGLYVLNKPAPSSGDSVSWLEDDRRVLWFSPVVKNKTLQSGAEVHWIAATF